jgi:hypothetical protein
LQHGDGGGQAADAGADNTNFELRHVSAFRGD